MKLIGSLGCLLHQVDQPLAVFTETEVGKLRAHQYMMLVFKLVKACLGRFGRA